MAAGAVPFERAAEEILERLPSYAGMAPTLRALSALAPEAEVVALLRRYCAEHRSPRVRFHADRALRALPSHLPTVDFGTPPEPARIQAGLADRDPETRFAAAGAASRLPAATANALLVAAINRPEKDPWILATLIAVLGNIGGESAAEEAAALLDHPSPRVAANALHALHRAEPETAALAAASRIDSEDNRIRANAILALFPSQPEVAWERVRGMLASGDEWMRASGCFLAAQLDHPEAEAALLGLLVLEKDPELVARAVEVLGAKGTSASSGVLLYLAKSRLGALSALAEKALAAVRTRDPCPEPEILEKAREFQAARHRAAPSGDASGVLKAPLPVRPPPSQPSPPPASPPAAQPGTGSGESVDLLANLVAEVVPTPTAPATAPTAVPATPPATVAPAAPAPGPPEGDEEEDPDAPFETSALMRKPAATAAFAIARKPDEDPLSPEKLRRVAGGIAGFLGVIALWTWATSTPRPPPRPATPPAEVAPGGTSRLGTTVPIRVTEGRVDLNSQPAAGQKGTWQGVVQEVSARRLVLAFEGGSRLAFRFPEDLKNPPRPGKVVAVQAVVYKKGRAGIEVIKGAHVEEANPP